MADTLNPNFFRRMDETDDELFYESPRFVVHIDDGAIEAVGEIYASRLPQGGAILDLMSSWRSHIPASVRPLRLVVIRPNRAGVDDNPALTEGIGHKVNLEPRVPLSR